MKNLYLILLGVLIYVITSLIITPFLSFSFGAKPPLYERLLKLFIEYPFGLFKNLSENYFLIMLFLNGFFWSIFLIKCFFVLKKLIFKL